MPNSDVKKEYDVSIVQFALLTLVGVVALLVTAFFYYPPMERQAELFAGMQVPFAAEASAGVNINTATWQELTVLKGIGEVKAKAIVAYREENGAFKRIGEILNVHGIGPVVFEDIKDLIEV